MALKEKKKNQQKNFSKSHSSTRTWYLGHRSSCRIQQTLHPPHDSSCLSNDAAHHLAETSFGQAPPCGASQIMISLTILTSLTGRTHQQMFLALRKLLEKVCTQKKLFPPLRMHPLLPFPNIHTHTHHHRSIQIRKYKLTSKACSISMYMFRSFWFWLRCFFWKKLTHMSNIQNCS